MKLVSFLLKEIGSVQEDRRSIRFRRRYHQNDLERLLPVMNECSRIGIAASLVVEAQYGDKREVCLMNFRLKKEGLELLIDNTAGKDGLTRVVAAARSAEAQPALLFHEFEKIIDMTKALFEIEIYVEKSELTRVYDKEADGSHYIWLTAENMKDSLMKDSQSLLTQMWSDRFPILVIPKSRPKHYGFCSIFADAGHVDSADQVRFSTARNLAQEMLKHKEATTILLALTFTPRDEESEQFLKTNLGLSFVGKGEFPFAEGQFYDFKSRPPAEISKSIAAFANACGGMIVFGIDKNGSVTGCNKVKDVDDVSNSLKEIEPAVKHWLIQMHIDGKFVFGIILSPPGQEVYSLSDGKRPFRQGSAIRSFRHDAQVLEARKATCVA
jgi:hypothetical protein